MKSKTIVTSTTTWHFRGGRLHREDGPAMLIGHCHFWYIDGVEYSFDRWCKELNISDELRTFLMLKYDTKSSRLNIDD